MIFQQHPKQEIARIVPLIGHCCVWRRRAPFSWKNVLYFIWINSHRGHRGHREVTKFPLCPLCPLWLTVFLRQASRRSAARLTVPTTVFAPQTPRQAEDAITQLSDFSSCLLIMRAITAKRLTTREYFSTCSSERHQTDLTIISHSLPELPPRTPHATPLQCCPCCPKLITARQAKTPGTKRAAHAL
jgi:hypothetical protein